MSPTSRGPEVAESPWAALAFWLGLLMAMAAFGAAALAPRIVGFTSLDERYEGNQRELRELERQISQLERVAEALEADPEFAAALARAEFGNSTSDGRLIPVEEPLVFDPWHPRTTRTPQNRTSRWFTEATKSLAADTQLRRQLFAFASLLILYTFSIRCLLPGLLQKFGLFRWFRSRYVRDPQERFASNRSRNSPAVSDSPEKSASSPKSFQAARSSHPIK